MSYAHEKNSGIPRDSENKDGLIKMLLQSSPLELNQIGSCGKQLSVSMGSSPGKHDEEGSSARVTGADRLLSLIQLDHAYSKPWRPDTSNTLPTKTLFMTKTSRGPTYHLPGDENEPINVETDPIKPVPPYDPRQARKAMSECERYIGFVSPGIEQVENPSGLEDIVPKDGWTPQQKALYNKMMKVLHQDRLSRLAQEGRDNEPVLRRITVDKSAKRARVVLSSFPTMWDVKSVQWLHSVFCDYLPRSYLAAWMDILQTLKSKVPALMDRVLAPFINVSSDSKIKQVMAEGLSILLNRPWDPAISSIARKRLEKLPGNPVIIVAPPGPGDPKLISRRLRLWNNQLGRLGKVIVINAPAPKGDAMYKSTVNYYLYQMVSATLQKVRDCKASCAERPVILMGWGPGAAIATHVAGVEKVAGLVCLGFPSTSLAGTRGELGDSLLDLKTPTLFVVGEKSTVCNSDDIEDLREKLSVETGLVIVGSADNSLRISKRKKRTECITQSMVDRSIMEEIREFLEGVMNSSARHGNSATFAVPSHDNIVSVGGAPRKVRGRKRNSSAGADGQGPVSPLKKSRPNTPGGGSGSGGSTPVKMAPVSPTLSAKKPRKMKKAVTSESSESPTGFPVQGLGSSNFPPGLLSISAPLPQSTLNPAPDSSPPPLPIRVPICLPLTSATLSPILQTPVLISQVGTPLVGIPKARPSYPSPTYSKRLPAAGVRMPVNRPNVGAWGSAVPSSGASPGPRAGLNILTGGVRTPVTRPQVVCTASLAPRGVSGTQVSSTRFPATVGSVATTTAPRVTTQRVIQYAAKSSKAVASNKQVNPTTPTWSLSGSRPVSTVDPSSQHHHQKSSVSPPKSSTVESTAQGSQNSGQLLTTSTINNTISSLSSVLTTTASSVTASKASPVLGDKNLVGHSVVQERSVSSSGEAGEPAPGPASSLDTEGKPRRPPAEKLSIISVPTGDQGRNAPVEPLTSPIRTGPSLQITPVMGSSANQRAGQQSSNSSPPTMRGERSAAVTAGVASSSVITATPSTKAETSVITSDKSSSCSTAATSSERGNIIFSTAAESAGGEGGSQDSKSSKESVAERQDVAQILASLSGFVEK